MNTATTSKNDVKVNNRKSNRRFRHHAKNEDSNNQSRKNHQKPITIWCKNILAVDLSCAVVKNNKFLKDCRLEANNGNILAEGDEKLLEKYLRLCKAIQEFKKVMDFEAGKKNIVLNEVLVSELWKNKEARTLAKTIFNLSEKKDFRFVLEEETVGCIVKTARKIAESVREHWNKKAFNANALAGLILGDVENSLDGKKNYRELPIFLKGKIELAVKEAGRYISEKVRARASKASKRLGAYEEARKNAQEEQARQEESRKILRGNRGAERILDEVEHQIWCCGVRYQTSRQLMDKVRTAIKLAGSNPSEYFNKRIRKIATSVPRVDDTLGILDEEQNTENSEVLEVFHEEIICKNAEDLVSVR